MMAEFKNSKSNGLPPRVGQLKANRAVKLQDNRPSDKLAPTQLQKKNAVSTASQPINSPIQLAKAKTGPTLAERRKEQQRQERKDMLKPWRKYDRTLASIKLSISEAEKEFEDIKGRLEDDDDLSELAILKMSLIKIKLKAPKVRRKIKNKPLGRFRNQDPEQKAYINQLDGFKHQIYLLMQKVRKMFPTHTGGFGAKGRAHQMSVEVNPHFPKLNAMHDNSFINNFAINGLKLTDNIHKSPGKVAKEKSGPALVMGNSNVALSQRSTQLALLESKLAPVTNPQPQTFYNAPVGKDRGDGQYASMQNTNAAGYAYIASIPDWKSQRWEWLHIRGAGLGGATNATNLVAGTRDSNTNMIPFESNIRLLGAAAHTSTNYNRLDVIWSASGPVAKAKHAFKTIQIEWLLRHKTNGSKNIKGIAKFSPLHTGSNISKKEVELVENALKEVRDKVN